MYINIPSERHSAVGAGPAQTTLQGVDRGLLMQVWIGVVPCGPNGVALNSSYQSRESPQYMSDLGNAIANFARLVPDGLLVFFPSYHVLEKCTNHWKGEISNGARTPTRASILSVCPVLPRLRLIS